jgi:hypothetical protein
MDRRDRISSQSWAIAPVVNAGLIVGTTMFELVNLDACRAHMLQFIGSGLNTQFGTAGGGAPSFTKFKTKIPLTFADFEGSGGQITSVNIGVVAGYSKAWIRIWGFDPRFFIKVSVGGWGPMIPGGGIVFGAYNVLYGEGNITGTVACSPLRLDLPDQGTKPLANIKIKPKEPPRSDVDEPPPAEIVQQRLKSRRQAE